MNETLFRVFITKFPLEGSVTFTRPYVLGIIAHKF